MDWKTAFLERKTEVDLKRFDFFLPISKFKMHSIFVEKYFISPEFFLSDTIQWQSHSKFKKVTG